MMMDSDMGPVILIQKFVIILLGYDGKHLAHSGTQRMFLRDNL